jgi:Protein of unknown function DUF262/Protein of unknown function (DUF1524)
MEVFKKTVSVVFSNERRYVIPLFQRPYVWTRENQWEPLWEDVVARAELEIEQPELDAPPHFLGAIVIQQRPSWGDELLAHDVIDGQQRLTTFQILLTAFHDLATAGEDKQVTASLRSWTRNANAITNPDVEQFKVWPTSRDEDQFRLVATAGSRAAIEKVHPAVFKRKRLLPRPRMVEAYLFFHEKLLAWLNIEGQEKLSERTKVLRRVFDKRMQLVSIELEKQEDPQAIFETLNARGVPLLASDLLRNYIFQRAGSAAEARRLHEKYWTRFEIPDDESVPDGARFWEVEERQGRLSRARLDLLVQHYLSMKRGSEVLSGRLFPEYKQWIESEPRFPTLDDELGSLALFSDFFYELLRPAAGSSVRRFAERLRAIDTSTVYPLVLAIQGNRGLDDAGRGEILEDLESFLVRRMVCGRPTKNYNRLFLQVLREFGAQPPSRSAFRTLLVAGTGENLDWPDDASFERAWGTVDAYLDLKAAKVEMVLRAINDAMVTGATETITVHGKLTVEHILPQKWKKHWALAADADVEKGSEDRDDVVHAFGNLTLITQPLNSTVSNGPATQKLTSIAGQSALRLNAYFQNRNGWDELDIAERSAALFRVAKKIWPRP